MVIGNQVTVNGQVFNGTTPYNIQVRYDIVAYDTLTIVNVNDQRPSNINLPIAGTMISSLIK